MIIQILEIKEKLIYKTNSILEKTVDDPKFFKSTKI